MELLHRLDYFRREHEALLGLAASIEKLLETASKNDYAERLKSLAALRSLDHGLTGIVEHCHAGNRIVESTYYRNFRVDERARIDAEHQQIIQAVASFREELKCATADRTMAMILPGMDVVNQLRSHISFEQELLDRIVEPQHPQKRAMGKKKTVKKTNHKKRGHVAKQRTHAKTTHALPYTLEPHPEL
jgi:hypothetical protein